MALPVFSGDWAAAWSDVLNASDRYRESAADWEGAIVFEMTAEPSHGLEEDRRVWMDLWKGTCREGRVATEADLNDAPFVISADPATWKRIFGKEVDPLLALMQGRLKLTRGNMATLARYVGAAKELVACATQVETAFPHSDH